jgi:hypothetical protein
MQPRLTGKVGGKKPPAIRAPQPHCLNLASHETMHSHVQNRVARLFIEKLFI